MPKQTSSRNLLISPLKNYLYYGDNLIVLRNKIKDASIDLCYIDPPFNSKRNYFQIYNNIGFEDAAQAQAFEDTWEWGDEATQGLDYILDIQNLNNSKFTSQTVALIRGFAEVLGKGSLLAYLVHMTLRIAEIYRVLKPTGSFYLHCDPTASHYLKLVCDGIFCGQGGDFKNEVIWKRTTAHSDGERFGRNADCILFYSKGKTYTWNQMYSAYTEKYKARFRNREPDGRLWMDDNLTAKGLSGGGYTYQYKGCASFWRVPIETMRQLDEEGRLHFTKNKGIRLKRYLDEAKGMPVQAIWEDISPLNSQAAERLGYPTQKPEALLDRIIQASSNEGDVILDAYCGCGTTVAVAQRLNRRWVGIDITYQSISLILKRLKDTYPKDWAEIEANLVLDGVPRDIKSAEALANRKDDKTRKEFEKWAILTYANNQARINDKKGADKGIDGIAFFMIDNDTNGKAIFQVKSGGANRSTIATLNSDRQRENAEFGILITMDSPTKAMRNEALAVGKYQHPRLNREDDRIQIVTIQEILDGERINLPLGRSDIVKSALASEEDQGTLF